ncbi:MAG TPA: site-specific DNA-methyltransferase [Euryarchaeota archaeon]|nr:site-specific DNA-methyltransferase [Euryarchaeota archaeon]
MDRKAVHLETSHRVIIGDSTRMNEIGEKSIQLVVTSPPYPMIEMWDGLFSMKDPAVKELIRSDVEEEIAEAYDRMHLILYPVIRECYRVLIEGGICCVNIGDAVRSMGDRFRLFANHSRMITTLESVGFSMLPYILWKKPTNKPNAFLGSGFLPTNAYVTLDCEFILIARKGGVRQFRQKDENRYRSSYTKEERDKWFSQIWNDIPGASQSTVNNSSRSAAYPIEIPIRLIRMFSVLGDTVLDPFLGTGTTVLAASKTGRNSVGFEIDRDAINWDSLSDVKGLELACDELEE